MENGSGIGIIGKFYVQSNVYDNLRKPLVGT